MSSGTFVKKEVYPRPKVRVRVASARSTWNPEVIWGHVQTQDKIATAREWPGWVKFNYAFKIGEEHHGQGT